MRKKGPKPGYKQTPEHIAKRIRLRGPSHPNWRGDAAAENTGRDRAVRRYPLKPCEECGKPGTERHHLDGSTFNNEPENIRILCHRCHMTMDGRIAALPSFVMNQGAPLNGGC